MKIKKYTVNQSANSARVLLFALVSACASTASAITIQSYTYGESPHGNYPDSTGEELRDGITQNPGGTWGNNTGPAQAAAFVGWLNSTPMVTFTFDGPVTIRSFTVWAADSEGTAGVALPSSFTLTTPGGFNESFSVVNPAGEGSTVPLAFSGFEVITSEITLTAVPTDQWTMFTEVEFAGIPEPSSVLLGGLGLLALLRRRR